MGMVEGARGRGWFGGMDSGRRLRELLAGAIVVTNKTSLENASEESVWELFSQLSELRLNRGVK